jgi:hypothetical protein
MQKFVGVTELQHRFRSVFDEVANTTTVHVILRSETTKDLVS